MSRKMLIEGIVEMLKETADDSLVKIVYLLLIKSKQ